MHSVTSLKPLQRKNMTDGHSDRKHKIRKHRTDSHSKLEQQACHFKSSCSYGKIVPILKALRLVGVWGSGSKTPRILNLGTRWKWVVSCISSYMKIFESIDCNYSLLENKTHGIKYCFLQIQVLWVVTPCSVVVGYQHFKGPSPWRWRQHGPPKRYPTTTLHGVTNQKTSIWIFIIAFKTWNLS